MSEKIGDFTLHHVNNTYDRSGDKTLRTHVNWELREEHEIWGTGFGTLIVEHDMENPNATSGKCSWQGEAFQPDGNRVMGQQEGTWETSGEHNWKTTLEGWDSQHGAVRTEGVISLENLTWSGTTYKAQFYLGTLQHGLKARAAESSLALLKSR